MAETSKRKVGRPKTKIPNIMQLSSSFIITDPKGKLCRDLEHHGYEVKVLNLLDMKKR